ncbi:MAG: hypothetical protein ACRD6R_11420 [Candidatus Polarisedimenticolia bacterium]
MTRALRYASRLLVVVALLTAVAVLVPAAAPGLPYVSALSDLAAVTVMAGPECPNKGCPMRGTRCTHKTGAGGCALIDGACREALCR